MDASVAVSNTIANSDNGAGDGSGWDAKIRTLKLPLGRLSPFKAHNNQPTHNRGSHALTFNQNKLWELPEQRFDDQNGGGGASLSARR